MNDKGNQDDMININSNGSGYYGTFEGNIQNDSAAEVESMEGHHLCCDNAEGVEGTFVGNGDDAENVEEGDGDAEEGYNI